MTLLTQSFTDKFLNLGVVFYDQYSHGLSSVQRETQRTGGLQLVFVLRHDILLVALTVIDEM